MKIDINFLNIDHFKTGQDECEGIELISDIFWTFFKDTGIYLHGIGVI